MKNNKGITLLALIITIIVMMILAGIALLFSVGDSGVISRAEKTQFLEDMKLYKEELELYKGQKQIENQKLNLPLDTDIGDDFDESDGPTIREKYIPSMKEKYYGKLKIVDGKLVFISSGDEEEDTMAEIAGLVVEENKDVEYNAPEEAVGSEFKSGLWQYKKNESGTLTITKYLGTTEEELTDVIVPNRINGQVVEYFDGFGKNLTGTLTISKGLKTLDKQGMNKKLANIKLNKLVIEEDVVIKSGYFFSGGTINEIEIKDNVILDADVIFSTVSTNNIVIGNNVQVLNNGFTGCIINEKISIGNNCKISGYLMKISAKKMVIGNNTEIFISEATKLEELVIGDNVKINTLSNLPVLKNVTLGKDIDLKGSNLFSGAVLLKNEHANAILRNSNETVNGQGLFSGCTGLTDIIIPSSKKISGQGMFNRCTNLKKLTIENNCEFLSSKTFEKLYLSEVIIGDNIKFNGGYTFSSCELLENITIGENCIFVDAEFNNDNNIKNIIIGKGVKGWATFMNCKGIENIIYYLTDEQINSCKKDINNVNKIINSENVLKSAINGNPTLTATFEEDKIVLRKVES